MLRLFLLPFSYFLNSVPYRVKLFLGSSIGLVLFHIFRFRRSIIIGNLTRAFGSEKKPEEIRELAKQNYIHYALVCLSG